MVEQCPICKGKGYQESVVCLLCRGSGLVDTQVVDLKVVEFKHGHSAQWRNSWGEDWPDNSDKLMEEHNG